MAFKQGNLVAVSAGTEATALAGMTRNTGAGNFTAGDYFTVVLPIQLSMQEWTNDDPNARTKSGKYPVVTVAVMHADNSPAGNQNIPLSSFCSKDGRIVGADGVTPHVEGRFSKDAQYTDIWNGLQALNGQRITCVETKYEVFSTDGSNKEPRSIKAWK